jgi:inorganic pyrophosphatase
MHKDEMAFWNRMDQFASHYALVIDRPRGSRHPRYPEITYPFDYGYLKGTQAMDQGGIDVWVGTMAERKVTAIICSVDSFKQDVELKILLSCTPQEADAILQFHNGGQQSAVLTLRPGEPK